MSLLVAMCFHCCFSIGAVDHDDALNREWKKLQGRWRATKIEDGGKGAPDEPDVQKVTLYVRGDQCRVTGFPHDGESKLVLFKLKIDPSKTPSEIDFASAEDPKVALLGIYKLDDEKLVVCFGILRPKEFKAISERLQWVVVFERERER